VRSGLWGGGEAPAVAPQGAEEGRQGRPQLVWEEGAGPGIPGVHAGEDVSRAVRWTLLVTMVSSLVFSKFARKEGRIKGMEIVRPP
jgi:hypothetical protein